MPENLYLNPAEVLHGAWDIHVHASPSLFPRWGDAEELTKVCFDNGMAGVVLKAHHGDTVSLAYVLNKKKGLHVFGGMVLNQFVGGLNPACVDSALQLGAKIIWLPTIHAKNHRVQCGCTGGFSFQKSQADSRHAREIEISDKNGNLKTSVKEILSILNKSGVVLGTGHISKKEIFLLHDFIKTQGHEIPLLINHVFFTAPGFEVHELERLQNHNTWFELSHLTYSNVTKAATYHKAATALLQYPHYNWILVSDSGQKTNLKAPEALMEFYSRLHEIGIKKSHLVQYAQHNPNRLINRG